ncbi:MAG TPA: hypothetical protein VKY85_01135 [Candidatus Angelobacter sp.]|nr:hypothetical protein [Candidatus Angelobacter sp.]
MKLHLSTLEYAIWFSAALLHATLGVVITVRGVHRRLPFFATQIYFCLASNIVCYLLAQKASLLTYAFANFGSTIIVDALYGCFLWREVYLTTFGPRMFLPAWVPYRFFVYTSGLYAAVLVTGVLLPAPWLGSALAAMAFLTRSLLGIMAAVCIVLIFYSVRLGISWRRDTLILTAGLLFSTATELAAAYSRYFVSAEAVPVLRQISSFSYLVTLALWMWGVSTQRVESEAATPEMLRQIDGELDRSAESASAWISLREPHS